MKYLKVWWDLIVTNGPKYLISTPALLISLLILMILLLLLLLHVNGIHNTMENILEWLL